MALQQISLPNQELQPPLSETADTRDRSLQQQDGRYFKYEFCHRADNYKDDRVSVLLCEGIQLGPPHNTLYALDICHQHNLTVESYINVMGHYERQQRASFECDGTWESMQSFCTNCPLETEPKDFKSSEWADEMVCNVEEQGCLPPYVFNLKHIDNSILRCDEDGEIGLFESEDSEVYFGHLDGLRDSCDFEYLDWEEYKMDHGIKAKFRFPDKVNDHDFMYCSDFDNDGDCPGFCQMVESTSLTSQFIEGERIYRTSEQPEEYEEIETVPPLDEVDAAGVVGAPVETPSNSLGSSDVHEEAHSSYTGGGAWSIILFGVLVGMLVVRRHQNRQHSSRHSGGPPPSSSAFAVPPCEYQMVEQGETYPSQKSLGF